MGIYDVELIGVHVKTRVVDHSSMVEQALEELKAKLPPTRLVAVDVKSSNNNYSSPDMLILQAGGCCVIFNLIQMLPIPKALTSFVGDQTIFFVGCFDDPFKFYTTSSNFLKVGLGELAARVLKKPKLCNKSDLEEIAREIGKDVEVPFCSQMLKINYMAKVFSEAEVKQLVAGAYACFFLASKLLSML